MRRLGIATVITFLGLVASACGGAPAAPTPTPVDAGEDTSPGVDLPAVVDVSMAIDAPVIVDAPQADLPGPLDVPLDVSGPCTSDAACVGSADGPACDLSTGRCVACTPTSDRCPAGQYCVAGMNRCATGCRNDMGCSGSTSRCDPTTHACVGCVTDVHCAAGSLCVGNVCVPGCTASRPCASGQTCCGGACADTQASSANCGGCGVQCMAANASSACRNGVCGIGSCISPFADCDGNPSNGCETNTRDDGRHCGGCSTTCPGVDPYCYNGGCFPACDPPSYRCGGPCAVETLFTCGPRCESCPNRDGPGTRTACIAGECSFTCTTGYHRCGSVCDREGLLSCGPRCERCEGAPWATASCDGTRCVNQCQFGRADCNGVAADGCEVDTTTTSNCGTCGRTCSAVAGPHTVAACIQGGATAGCGAACESGWRDCDNNLANGCEVTGSCFITRDVYSDNFMTGANNWNFANAGQAQFGVSPDGGRNPTFCFGCWTCIAVIAGPGNCGDEATATATLQSTFDFSRVDAGTLSFYGVGNPGSSDRFIVQATTNGGASWLSLPTPLPCSCSMNSAPQLRVDLAPVAGARTVQFRFLYQDQCDERNGRLWYVDDVAITVRERTF